jgi:hypothetical protein
MEEIRNKLICFGSNGVDVFRSVHNGLKTQFEKVQLLSFFCPLNYASNKPSNFKHFPKQPLV